MCLCVCLCVCLSVCDNNDDDDNDDDNDDDDDDDGDDDHDNDDKMRGRRTEFSGRRNMTAIIMLVKLITMSIKRQAKRMWHRRRRSRRRKKNESKKNDAIEMSNFRFFNRLTAPLTELNTQADRRTERHDEHV